jgi:hypothetical protein
MAEEASPAGFSDDDARAIFKRLEEKGLRKDCPMCSKGTFALVDGFVAPNLFRDLPSAGQILGPKNLFPCVALVCNNCGFTSSHALSYLGLLDLFTRGGQHG